VRKRYPSKLRIALRQRRMAALLFQDPILAIDDEGVVIETLTPRHPKALDFPFISGLPSERARLGDRIRNEALANALLLLSCLSAGAPDLLKKTSEVHCGENSHITLLLESGTEIRFGAGNPVRKMPLLETFLAKMGSPDQFAYVELRFEGQIPYKLR
jgi:cell division septal protein FtsQ